LEHLGGDVLLHSRSHFLGGRPDVLEEHVFAGLVFAERLGGKVEIDTAGQRVGHDQRRTCQVVRPHVWRDAPLEVAIPRQHADRDQLVVVDGLADRLR
jgi:hypothetical protein